MATSIGGGMYGHYGAALPAGKTAEQLAAEDLAQANQHNAFRVDGNGNTVLANGQGSATAQPMQPMQPMQAQPQPNFSANLGFGGPAQWGQSPWVDQTARALTNRSNQNLAQNVMPAIRSGAQGAGQYGSSRQGIAEGVAAGNAQTGLDSALASLYSSAYGQDQNAALQNKGLDNSYDLGLRSNDLGFSNLDYNINQGNFANQLAGANLGLSAYNAMMNGNQAGITAGNNIQQTPYNNWSNFNTAANNVGQGLASGSTTQTMPGNPFMGALGGYQLGSNLGFTPPVVDGGYSIGQGPAYGGNRQGM